MPQHRQDNSFPDDRSPDPIQNSYRLNPDLAGGDQSKSSASPERDFRKQSAPQSAKQSSDYWLQYGAKGARILAATLSRVTGSQSSQVLTLWPSGDFSVGNAAPPKRDNGEDPLGGIVRRPMPWLRSDDEEYFNYMLESGAPTHEIAFQNRQPPRSDRQLSESEAIHLFKLIQKAEERGQSIPLEEINRVLGALAPMGLSVPTNLTGTPTREKSPRRQPGLNGISSRGKRTLRSACTILEREHDRRCFAFLTCTLPALSPSELETVAQNWPKILHNYKKFLSRRLGEFASSLLYCTELQEQRTKLLRGLPVLHVHFVFVGRSAPNGDWLVSKEEARDGWRRILEPVIGRSLNCDYATRIESPRGSLKREIGKYLSKGTKSLKAALEAGFHSLIPRQWWGCARELSRKVRTEIKRFSDGTVAVVVQSLDSLQRLGILKYRSIEIQEKVIKPDGEVRIDPQTGEPITTKLVVGYVGFFTVENPVQFMVASFAEMELAMLAYLKDYNLRCKRGYKANCQQKMIV